MKEETLKFWVKNLTEQQKEKVILNLIDYAMDSMDVRLSSKAKKPFWNSSGETLDGTQLEESDF